MSIRRSLPVLGATMLFLCAVMIGGAVYARHQARVLIEKIRDVDGAVDPTAASRSLMRLYSDRLVSQGCDREFCQYQFLFNNGVISKFHIVPRAEIKVYVDLYRGALTAVDVEYTSAVFKADSPIVTVQEDFCANRTDITCDHFDLNPHGRDVVPTWNGIVEFGQKATKEQKRAAWALNLDCVTAFHGCRDISQLLPTIWKLAGPATVSSRVRSTADSIAETSQPLPE